MYSMVTESPFLGIDPLPSARIVLVTPRVAAVMEKFLVAEVESLGNLAADVRSEERNIWREVGGVSGSLYVREKSINSDAPPRPFIQLQATGAQLPHHEA